MQIKETTCVVSVVPKFSEDLCHRWMIARHHRMPCCRRLRRPFPSTGRLSVPLVRHAVDDPQRPEVCTDGRREHRHYAPSVRRASRNRVHPSTSSVRRHLRRWRRARSVDALPGPRVRKKEQRASLHVQHRVLAAPVFRRVPGGRREDVRAGVRLRGLRAFRMRERRGRQRRPQPGSGEPGSGEPGSGEPGSGEPQMFDLVL